MSDLLTRITIDPALMHGHPCIRGLRVTVADVLNFLSVGQSRDEILGDILISKVPISTRSSLLPRARLIILLSPRNRPCFFSSARSFHPRWRKPGVEPGIRPYTLSTLAC